MTSVELVFDAEAHPSDAIQRAAYRFSDRFSLELRRDGDDYCCVLHAGGEELNDELIGDFRIEVLDQVLRERIRVETQDVRNLILALAFSQTDLSTD